jgi:hypothetical protein
MIKKRLLSRAAVKLLSPAPLPAKIYAGDEVKSY